MRAARDRVRRECVWDYPRPPRSESTSRRVRVVFQGHVLADTVNAIRVLETSHPPVYYVPPGDVDVSRLRESGGSSRCEYKGIATYFDAIAGPGSVVEQVAWSYPDPLPAFRGIRDHFAFYAAAMDVCSVDGEVVVAQAGDFYGGWITSDLDGPFKGGRGTRGW